MQETISDELNVILKEMVSHAPSSSACGDLSDCLTKSDWVQVRLCCVMRLESYANSQDLYAIGLAYMQLAVLGARKVAAPDHREILYDLRRAIDVFSIRDGRCAALALMALGKYQARLSQWHDAADAYQQSIEILASRNDPIVERARRWRSDLNDQMLSSAGQQEDSAASEQAGPPSDDREPDASKGEETPTSAPKGKILRMPHNPLKFRLVPVCQGRVAAGMPILAQNDVDEYMTTETFSIAGHKFYLRADFEKRPGTRVDKYDFALLVTGRSMEETIHDGDCVLVRKIEAAENDIVIVRIPSGSDDNLLTVKRLHREKDHVRLSADNPEEQGLVIVKKEDEARVRQYYGAIPAEDRPEFFMGSKARIEGRVMAVLSPTPDNE